ncbi:cysteine synthase family protein [Bacillus wiedmannii]|uniref:cysteine synthase family protein n=1 Tax=Bacillus wiedmannii TaxID=1890302 RepID=UPI000BF27898|nr:cysteine synthase family protein [Bacillus wiedmannii]PFY98371.1 hypothetical protein COL57_10840 [Bacillus wiedmannii]
MNWPFEHFELPRVEKLSQNLYGASFFLMKLLPARFMLQEAEKNGLIKSGSKIIETTSGTFGLALAMISAKKGYNLTLVSDPAIDNQLNNRLKDLGAEVVIINDDHPEEKGGYQKLRLDYLNKYLNEHPDTYWPSQYDNKNNSKSYSIVAEHFIKTLGEIDVLVGPVGSGGSMCGISTFLRGVLPELEVIGVDTNNSVLFGQPDGKRLIRGLGNSILPQNLDHTIFDYVSWVPGNIAFNATRKLHRDHGLFMGGTSGASYLVGDWYSKQYPDKKVVCLFPDEGHRYIESIYNDEWINKYSRYELSVDEHPYIVEEPCERMNDWTFLHWNNSELKDEYKNLSGKGVLK